MENEDLQQIREALAVLGELEVEPMREGDKFTWIKPAIAGTAGRMRPEIANAIVALTKLMPAVLNEIDDLKLRIDGLNNDLLEEGER